MIERRIKWRFADGTTPEGADTGKWMWFARRFLRLQKSWLGAKTFFAEDALLRITWLGASAFVYIKVATTAVGRFHITVPENIPWDMMGPPPAGYYPEHERGFRFIDNQLETSFPVYLYNAHMSLDGLTGRGFTASARKYGPQELRPQTFSTDEMYGFAVPGDVYSLFQRFYNPTFRTSRDGTTVLLSSGGIYWFNADTTLWEDYSTDFDAVPDIISARMMAAAAVYPHYYTDPVDPGARPTGSFYVNDPPDSPNFYVGLNSASTWSSMFISEDNDKPTFAVSRSFVSTAGSWYGITGNFAGSTDTAYYRDLTTGFITVLLQWTKGSGWQFVKEVTVPEVGRLSLSSFNGTGSGGGGATNLRGALRASTGFHTANAGVGLEPTIIHIEANLDAVTPAQPWAYLVSDTPFDFVSFVGSNPTTINGAEGQKIFVDGVLVNEDLPGVTSTVSPEQFYIRRGSFNHEFIGHKKTFVGYRRYSGTGSAVGNIYLAWNDGTSSGAVDTGVSSTIDSGPNGFVVNGDGRTTYIGPRATLTSGGYTTAFSGWSSDRRAIYYDGTPVYDEASIPAGPGYEAVPPRGFQFIDIVYLGGWDGYFKAKVLTNWNGSAWNTATVRLRYTPVAGLVISKTYSQSAISGSVPLENGTSASYSFPDGEARLVQEYYLDPTVKP